jgi:hypothetical protein
MQLILVLLSCCHKGTVQQKLRWVKISINCLVLAWDCSTGHYFVVSLDLHFGFITFPFLVSTAQFIGEFWKNRYNGTSDVVPIVLAPYRGYSQS